MYENDNVQGNGRFVQIKAHEDHREFELLDIWTTVIPAKLSHTVITKLRPLIPQTIHPLTHISRVVKEKVCDGVEYKRLVICDVATVPELSKVESIIVEAQAGQGAVVERKQCSRYPGKTKEQSKEWSERAGWPLMWRGNVDLIPTKLDDEECDYAAQQLRLLVERGTSSSRDGSVSSDESRSGSETPLSTPTASNVTPACLIVDPAQNRVVVSKTDTRASSKNPLNHCIMEALHEAAKLELERRPTVSHDEHTYLCLNMHVYLTHEPCVMCAMALNHSRIAKLFYVSSSVATGGIEPGSGGGHCVHWNKNLNWEYQVWKYIGSDFGIAEYAGNV